MIELLIVLAIGIFLGYKVASVFHIRMIKLILQELNITEKDLKKMAERHGVEFTETSAADPEMEEHEIKVEQHGSMIYAFKVENDEFLGQGTDREDLVNRIATRYKNVRFTVAEGAELLQENNTEKSA